MFRWHMFAEGNEDLLYQTTNYTSQIFLASFFQSPCVFSKFTRCNRMMPHLLPHPRSAILTIVQDSAHFPNPACKTYKHGELLCQGKMDKLFLLSLFPPQEWSRDAIYSISRVWYCSQFNPTAPFGFTSSVNYSFSSSLLLPGIILHIK